MLIRIAGQQIHTTHPGVLRVVSENGATDLGMLGVNDVLDAAAEYQEIRNFHTVIAKFPIGANVVVPVRACSGNLMNQLAGFFTDPRRCAIEVETRVRSSDRTIRFPNAWIEAVTFDPIRQEGELRFYAHIDERLTTFLEIIDRAAA